MRTSTIVMLAFMFTSSLVYGQEQQLGSYAWRASPENPQTNQVQTPVARVARAIPQQRVQAPAAPQMKRNPFLVSFRKPQEPGSQSVLNESLLDTQPSVSDANDYSFKTPTAPEIPGNVVTQSAASPEPQLAVTSNAVTPEASPIAIHRRKIAAILAAKKSSSEPIALALKSVDG